MEANKNIEYSCSECNAIVQENDEQCPNCGASLEDKIEYFRYSKVYHRFIYYLILLPILYVVVIFLSLFLLEPFFENSLELNLFLDDAANYATVLFPLIFTFVFLRLSKLINIIIGLSIGIFGLLMLMMFKYFGFNFILVGFFSTIFLYEIIYSIVKKEKYITPSIVLTVFIIWFYFDGLYFIPEHQVYSDLLKNVLIKNERETFFYEEDQRTIDDNRLSICYVEEKEDTFYVALYYKESFAYGLPNWEYIKYEKKPYKNY